MSDSVASFGQWVRKRRKQRALTQKALGRMVGYAEITVRQIEHDTYVMTRFVVECLINALAGDEDDQDAILRFALAQSQASDSTAQRQSIPTLGTPFYGRDTELAYLFELLNDPECRCISIVGVGGVGKTRLARRTLEIFSDSAVTDAHFINLTDAISLDWVTLMIADDLRLSLNPFMSPLDQLLQLIETKTLLLVLDNFEQLLPNGVELIQTILARAPRIKLIVTSRERLNLTSEWCLRLEGLDTSERDTARSEAAALFINTARRINYRFVATEGDPIPEICRVLQGIPLAIEMAASWTEVRSCREILMDISAQMLELTTRQRGIEDRHRSLRIVFESTWAKLSSSEQKTLKRLSIFHGGFTVETAKGIVHTSKEELAFLQDKMLIQSRGDDRFILHELIRQLAYQKLALDDTELLNAKLAHAGYFCLRFLENSAERLKHYHTHEENARLLPEVENIIAAWNVMLEQRRADWFWQCWESLSLFFNTTSRFVEGENLFRSVFMALDGPNLTEDQLRMRHYGQVICGLLIFRQGRLPEASLLLNAPELDVLRASPNAEDRFWVYSADSFIQHGLGNVEAASASNDAMADALKKRDYEPYHDATLYLQLGRVSHLMGDKVSAYDYLSEGVRICRENGIFWGECLTLTELGFVAEDDQRLADALEYYQAALASMTTFEELWNYVRAQISIGRLKMALRQVKEAVNIQRMALQTLIGNPALGFEIDCFVEIGVILNDFGDPSLAVILLEYCASHPECFQPIRNRAIEYLTSIRDEMPALELSATRSLFPATKPEVARMLLHRLTQIYNGI